MANYHMANCDNIFCSHRSSDGSCSDEDYELDRVEWCRTLKLYREYSHKIKIKKKVKKTVRKIP